MRDPRLHDKFYPYEADREYLHTARNRPPGAETAVIDGLADTPTRPLGGLRDNC